MSPAERVGVLLGELGWVWQTTQELARRLDCPVRAVRWGLLTIARSQPVFCRHRDPRRKEYRILPEARDVRIEDFARVDQCDYAKDTIYRETPQPEISHQ